MSTGALTKFAHAQIANAQGTLVAAIASGKAAYITNIKIYNNNGTDETITLWVNDGTNSYKVWGATLGAGEYADPGRIDLVAGESVEGATTTAAKVTFRAAGILETI